MSFDLLKYSSLALALGCSVAVDELSETHHDAVGTKPNSVSELTVPVLGAKALPTGANLVFPLKAAGTRCGEIIKGYGPGSAALHDGIDKTGGNNDFYAFDATIHRNYFSDPAVTPMQVIAVAPGTVELVQYAADDNVSSDYSTYGNRVYVHHQLGGRDFYSLYAHLDSIQVEEGQSVTAGQSLGIMGNSGLGTTGQAHLHFAMYEDAIEFTEADGATRYMIAGAAVVPEPMAGVGLLTPGMTFGCAN